MRLLRKACVLVLLYLLLVACNQPDNGADAQQQSTANVGNISASEQEKLGVARADEINCPPENYAAVSTLDEEQLSPLFEIANFSLDGQLTRNEFDSNPRYVEIALFGAEFLATTDVAISGIVDVTSTPPISKNNAARLAKKLVSLKKDGQYARTGAMGTLQAKTKTCLLMVKNNLP